MAQVEMIRSWDEEETEKGSHVVEIIKDGFHATKVFGKSLLLLDPYFLSVPVLKVLVELNENAHESMDILVKAKMSCVAYEKLIKPQIPKRGRPRKKGDDVKLKKLFTAKSHKFIKAKTTIYGKEEVEYLVLNLLWGKGFYKELRFVLVKY
jgi:hypothetical protein